MGKRQIDLSLLDMELDRQVKHWIVPKNKSVNVFQIKSIKLNSYGYILYLLHVCLEFNNMAQHIQLRFFLFI